MDRRQFLGRVTAGSLGLSLSACGSNDSLQPQLLVVKNAIPAQLFRAYRQIYPYQLEPALRVVADNRLAFQQLRKGEAETGIPSFRNQRRSLDLVSLGDSWLQAAIAQNLIEPLNPDLWSHWSRVESRWQQLVQRNAQGLLDPAGQIWAAPFRWGTTLMVYWRSAFEKFPWKPQGWRDLWRPELKQRFSLPDDAREVIGLTLKRLGHSYNTLDPQQVGLLKPALGQLQQHVKLYSSDDYLKPLLLEDTWLAVGWSTDILPLLRRDPRFGAVIPGEGTALWADCWVKPSSGTLLKAGVKDWINFGWSPTAAPLFSTLGDATAVVSLSNSDSFRSDPVRTLLYPDTRRLQQSEAIAPLEPRAEAQYKQLWQQMRRGQLSD
jgi:putative spermidine/putrescine transport system substrate-binding protein